MEKTLTAVITNHNYGRYLIECIDSALKYCDKVIIADDGSTDNSRDILNNYIDNPKITCELRSDASGDPIWGSNIGIMNCTTTHLIFLDADNWLVNSPPTLDYDYVFCDIMSCRENGSLIETLSFSDWDTDAKECLETFVSCIGMPFPWGGVWSMDFIKDLRWRGWRGTGYAADWRTAVDWCLQAPTIIHSSIPFLAFRNHDLSYSNRQDDGPQLCHDDAVKTAAKLKTWV